MSAQEDLSLVPTTAIMAEAESRKAAWGAGRCHLCGDVDPTKPCKSPEHAKYACRHADRKVVGRDPEGDRQYRCDECGRTWWWP